MRHLDEGELLRYADGELLPRAASRIRSHLEACWECRVALEELQSTIGECVRYRKDALQRFLPPPAPWSDIYRKFDQIDASMEPAFFSRLSFQRVLHAMQPRAWVYAVLALIVIGALVYRFSATSSVQAAELLRKAVLAESSRPRTPRRLQIRTRNRIISPRDTEQTARISALFRTANYNWDNPLSAKSYQRWRDQLPDKRDEVTEETDAYQLRTSTVSGELLQATLKLARRDMRPIEERLEFRNREWVEIAEVAGEESDAPSSLATSVPGVAHSVEASPVTAPSVAPSAAPPVSLGDELHVLSALHQIGADLGDPLEVSRNSNEVVVTGAGVSPERQREIRDAIARPNVVVRFSAPATTRLTSEAQSSGMPISDDGLQLQARIAERFGGRANFELVASQVLDLSEPMMARAHALRRLAERFSPQEEFKLSGEDRQLLKSLCREHAMALRQSLAEIDRLVKPVLEPVSVPAVFPGSWQPATEELFQSARRVDRLLAVMFGASPGETSGRQIVGELSSNLAQLRARLEVYDRVTGRGPVQ